MTPLKPEEIQAASEWFNSHYCQSECAHYNTICRALAFTLAANGEPSEEVLNACVQAGVGASPKPWCPEVLKKFIAKIWEEC